MPTNYLPTRESELLSWATNFNNYIQTGATTYGLTPEQGAEMNAAQAAFDDAYQTVQNPSTRSPTNIEIKNQKKSEMITLIRQLVAIIQAFPGTTDAMRSDLGITIRDNTPTPTPIPTTAPELAVTGVNGRLFDIQLREEGTDRRGKPSKVQAAWIYTAFGEEQPTTFETFTFRGEARRTDTQIVMPQSVAPGTKVWVSACWVNNAGKPGPASLPIATWTTHGNMNVAA